MKLEFHHINYVSKDVDKMHDFYTRLLGLADIPQENFPRTEATGDRGFDGKIRFAAFAKEWHQVFFQDPEGNVIEVHQQVG